MKVEWAKFKPGDELPPMGEYWLVASVGTGLCTVQIGSVVYNKPKNIFRTEEYGGLNETEVTHYAKFERPEMPT